MKQAVLFVHGKFGSGREGQNYQGAFPGIPILGAEYDDSQPWLARQGIRQAYEELHGKYDAISLIGSSVGCWFSMLALQDCALERAYFLAPVLDMERLIRDRISWANVTEEILQSRRVIPVDFGDPLSWEYLQYVRANPIHWKVPTHILYPGKDHLTPRDAAEAFAAAHTGSLTVLEGAEHYLHTPEEAAFIEQWLIGHRQTP